MICLVFYCKAVDPGETSGITQSGILTACVTPSPIQQGCERETQRKINHGREESF